MRMHTAAFVTTLLVIATPASGSEPTDIAGRWEVLDGGKPSGAVMRLAIQDGELVGTVEKTAPSIPPGATCAKCKPPLRGRPIEGLPIMWGFRRESDGTWTGGVIIDPRSGDTYRSKVYVKGPSLLEVRGYVGIPLLGASQTWRRLP